MQKALTMILMIVIAGYAAACLLLFVAQRSLIYFPPQRASLAAPQTSTLAVPDAQLIISERPRQGNQAVIYLGGNAEDVSASLPLLDSAFPDHALYLMHYRGYAGSSGKPSEKALVADALALFDRVHRQHGQVVVIGRSLGTGIAVQVAALRPVSRLVLVTPFDSLGELAARRFPVFPVRWLLQDRYETGKYAPRVQAPTLILAAEHDEIIPASSTQRLFSRFAQGVASMRVIAGTGHNSISDSAAYIPALQRAQ